MLDIEQDFYILGGSVQSGGTIQNHPATLLMLCDLPYAGFHVSKL